MAKCRIKHPFPSDAPCGQPAVGTWEHGLDVAPEHRPTYVCQEHWDLFSVNDYHQLRPLDGSPEEAT